jgi:hypothetical protein
MGGYFSFHHLALSSALSYQIIPSSREPASIESRCYPLHLNFSYEATLLLSSSQQNSDLSILWGQEFWLTISSGLTLIVIAQAPYVFILISVERIPLVSARKILWMTVRAIGLDYSKFILKWLFAYLGLNCLRLSPQMTDSSS